MKKEFKKVSFPVAIVIFLIVAAIMAVGLAILKLNTMVTFLLAFIAMGVIAAILGMSLVPAERSEPEKPLADLPRVLSGLERATESLYSASEITVTELKLEYEVKSDPVSFIPVWVAEAEYTVPQQDGSLLRQTSVIHLDAFTGEEIAWRPDLG